MRFEFGIGTRYTAGGSVISNILRAELVEATILAASKVFGGCFVQEGKGGWYNEGGELVVEPGITVTVDTPRGNATDGYWQQQARELAEHLRQTWDQEAIHLSWSVTVACNFTAADAIA